MFHSLPLIRNLELIFVLYGLLPRIDDSTLFYNEQVYHLLIQYLDELCRVTIASDSTYHCLYGTSWTRYSCPRATPYRLTVL